MPSSLFAVQTVSARFFFFFFFGKSLSLRYETRGIEKVVVTVENHCRTLQI